MTDQSPDRLYALLPALYRVGEDESNRFPLRGLLRLVTEQAEILRLDIAQLWDNFFIDTCAPWAIPYIGDLVGNNLLHDGSRSGPDTAGTLFLDLAGRDLGSLGRDLRPGIAARTRTDVAKTIYYRRRKGTTAMLEELARDVTGWGAHVVEFFELLDWAQHLNHLRASCHECPDLRYVEPLDRLDGPFDRITHSVDVPAIGEREGWYNIRNIGVLLWRLRSYPMRRVAARRAGAPWRYHVSPLGNPAPLFSAGRPPESGVLATEIDVAGPIRPAAFYTDLADYQATPPPTPTHTAFYGLFEPVVGSAMPAYDAASFVILADGVPVDPVNLRCRDLGSWSQPSPPLVGVDVLRGRIAFGTAPQRVDVYYYYGFSADLGGGPYRRPKWLVRADQATLRLRVSEGAVAPDFPTLGAALAAWAAQGRPNTIISILDNRTYAEPMQIELADDRWLAIEAGDGLRPHFKPDNGQLVVAQDHPGAELTLSGLLIEGGVHATGEVARLRLLHSTLVPGRSLDPQTGEPATQLPSLVVEGTSGGTTINARLRVQIAYCITGPIRLPQHADGLWLLDSIIDGVDLGAGVRGTALAAEVGTDRPGPPATIEHSTILGASFIHRLPLASETVFTDPVTITERQDGCVRFSFVPRNSATPRRHRCQPSTAIQSRIAEAEKAPGFGALTQAQQDAVRAAIRAEVTAWLVPAFTTLRYGMPAYAQLHQNAPTEITTGAEDGSEMGAFSHLKQPQRATNLRIRFDEYLPFGLDAGLIRVT
jgi:hypothetical protein